MFNPSDDNELASHHSRVLRRTQKIHLSHLPLATLHIGGIYASCHPVKIKTLLGSCIAACLFDASTGIGGMNHFLLPGTTDDPELSTRYGINAMEVLINEMMNLGAKRRSIRAKIFGGGDIFQTHRHMIMVGEKNIRCVEDFLETESIPIVTRRVGGKDGLMVVYLAHTFDVFVKPLSTERFRFMEEDEVSYREKITHELLARRSENITLF